MTDTLRIAGDRLSAEIALDGAELFRLQDEQARDLLWDGDPAFWTGRAPILFPVVGMTAGDTIRIDGRAYPMAKHGFARRRRFDPVEQSDTAVTLRLRADAETRAAYPFDFTLDLRFAVEGAALLCAATLHNDGERELPASFGYHPAFRWPLPWGGARSDHRIAFEHDEPQPIRRIGSDGLLHEATEPSPVAGRDLVLRDALFEDDALIFDPLHSREVRYGVPGGRQLAVSFPDMPLLGIWTKPGAPYICIEPWQGIADPAGYSGAFRDKPGVIAVAAGAARQWRMRIDTGE